MNLNFSLVSLVFFAVLSEETQLKISLNDLLSADRQGKWIDQASVLV